MNLPRTDFPMKADLPKREPDIIKVWTDRGIYKKVITENKARHKFILHDGPPYANGNIHLGTALNKILKDIVVKSKNMSGCLCEYVPGWDCHGLPIELQVEKELGEKKKAMEKVMVRDECRAYAERFVKIQREEFERLGCLGQWAEPYLTMSPEYEARIEKEFARIVKKGLVYREKKPVTWCPSCETALAEAEVEYEDHTSPSIYVAFPLPGAQNSFPGLKDEDVSIVIWTTTPWTIPANLAICFHPELEYTAVKVLAQGKPPGGVPIKGRVIIVLRALIDRVMKELRVDEYELKETFRLDRIKSLKARHPLYDRDSVLLPADYVSQEEGTGCVHTAPGHGVEDYITGKTYGVDIYSPVDSKGRFASDVQYFGGKNVFEANGLVLEELNKRGALLAEGKLSHSYPHCWRCKNPVIFRATEQWFISMDRAGLRELALKEIDSVVWIPPWGVKRISGMISVRPDWCISRQRAWGVPIAAFYCTNCGKELLDAGLVESVAGKFKVSGADVWFEKNPEEFLPSGTKCPACGQGRFKKEEDILDVWFDSGISHAAVLEPRGEWPADLYLEGSDQHRGWFHTSLLHSVATRQKAPYKAVLTHGFIVDGQGRKMSKSLGNFVSPGDVIEKHGAEALRLWVSAEDYREDIRFSEEILLRLIEAYRKIRNTMRFMLGNLSDFNPEIDSVPYKEMPELEKYIIHKLARLTERIRKAYEEYEFHVVFHSLLNFCAVDLSAFYFDIIKDCLYTFRKDSRERRACQTVLYRLLTDITPLMAPILSFTAEEVWRYIPGKGNLESVFLAKLPEIRAEEMDNELEKRWATILGVREEVFKALERARKSKMIGSSLEAKVGLSAQPELHKLLKGYEGMLRYIFIVSQVTLDGKLEGDVTESEIIEGLKISVGKALGKKCSRCWNYSLLVGQDARHPEACERCVKVLEKIPSSPKAGEGGGEGA